jgi:hypothetical protein
MMWLYIFGLLNLLLTSKLFDVVGMWTSKVQGESIIS